MHVFMLALLAACTGDEPADEAAAPVPPVDARPVATDGASNAVYLDTLEPTSLELPDSVRPDGADAPDAVAVRGPFRYVGTTRKGLHQWVTPFPARPRGLFFHKPESGLALEWSGSPLPYGRFGPAEPMAWVHDRQDITLYTQTDEAPPDDGSLQLVWPAATERERALNVATSESSPEDFLRASIHHEWDVQRGLALPAPARVEYRLEVPLAAELTFRPGIVPPELDEGIQSDGASVVVEVRPEGADWTEVARMNAALGAFPLRFVDLSPWAGQRIDLALSTHPEPVSHEGTANADLDYVFLGAPRLGTRRASGRRVVLVFIDTLRPDHMSLYGYERDTTAPLDKRFGDAAVFTNAHSVAPWTLPSARTALTGRHPESWPQAVPLPAHFHARGEPTAFLAGNIYLSSQFGLDRGWDLQRVELWPSADDVTDDAIDWLDEHQGMGGLLQVHYMDPHLPYLEPESHRHLYAGDGDGTLREQFHLSDVRKLGSALTENPASLQWIRDRYDNNIRYTADAVARLLDHLDDNDVVVLYSDHGEEFFDHTGFEHGHSLFEELLKVPLVIRAPGLSAGVYDEPVSLLDIAPTVTNLAGIDPLPDVDGMDLTSYVEGDAEATQALADRALGFGRLLYGRETWGLLAGGVKYQTVEGRERVYQLDTDPLELDDVSRKDHELALPYRARLPEALGMDVAVGWRFQPTRTRPGDDAPMEAICSFPSPIRHATVSVDPLGDGSATVQPIEAEAARQTIESWDGTDPDHPVREEDVHLYMTWQGVEGQQVVVEPEDDLDAVGEALRCTARWCSDIRGLRPCPVGIVKLGVARGAGFGPARTGLGSVGWGRKRQLIWGLSIFPVLPDGGATDGSDDELRESLEAIGYVSDEEGP